MNKLWKKTKELARQADSLGSKVELTIRGSSLFKTYLGALLSLGVFGLLIWYTVTVVTKILDRENPLQSTATEYDINTAVLEISKSDLLPVMNFYNKETGTVASPSDFGKYLTFQAKWYRSYFDYDTQTTGYEIVKIPVVICNLLKNKKPYELLFQNDNLKKIIFNLYCLDMPEGDFLISGDRMTPDIKSLSIEFFPCSLANSADCVSASELSKWSVVAVSIKKYLRNSDFDYPIKSIVSLREELNLQANVQTIIFDFIKETKIVDNTNWIQPSHEDWSFTELEREEVRTGQRDGSTHCPKANILAGTCFPYLILTFRQSGTKTTVTRTYNEILAGFSDVGGFKEVVLICVAFIYGFYNEFFMSRFLIDHLIPRSVLVSLSKDKAELREIIDHIKKDKEVTVDHFRTLLKILLPVFRTPPQTLPLNIRSTDTLKRRSKKKHRIAIRHNPMFAKR